jgi:hypothetical protein
VSTAARTANTVLSACARAASPGSS